MKTIITAEQMSDMDRRVRARLINCVSGYKTGVLIGTQSNNGQTNLALFASLIHIGANPPLLGFMLRPETVERHTMQHIRQTGSYTINYVSEQWVEKAHRTSASYPSDTSEFDACGFTKEYVEGIAAPFVAESGIKMGMELVSEVPVEVNDTILVVGRVNLLILPEGLMAADGFTDLSRQSSVVVSGLEAYYRCEPVARFGYARPGTDTERLTF